MAKAQKELDYVDYNDDNINSSSAMCRRSKDAVLLGGISYFRDP